MKSKYRSFLSSAKGSGASGKGTEHWIEQRITAIVMTLALLWVVYFLFCLFSPGASLANTISVIQKPYNAVMLIFLTAIVYYHGYIGVQVVIEDYVSCRAKANFLLITCKYFSIITVIAQSLAIINVMNV